ncbi:roundabout homolog 1-like isoform X2 [Dreissena polymorpha]|uniref:roundabout homolog 1-like isoform X2 n=1 Tax=Dreissena polymorpha TaxID=45954 RepID=UPI002264E27A|nr:roundabout homolog 1-like isoform X2 [Dreissena polymorpha]
MLKMACLRQLLLVVITVNAFWEVASVDYEDEDLFRNAPNLRHSGQSPPGGNPRIKEHPQDEFFAKSEPAALSCTAEGTPEPTITWYRNGELVRTTRDDISSHRMLLDNGQLFFLRVIHTKSSQDDVGVYYCNATNIHGSAISDSANVQIAVLKDKFITEPTDTTSAVGQSVTLHCNPPRGKPDPKVIWRKDGMAIQTDARVHITESGNLDIYSVKKTDIGEYMCVAINKAGDRHSAPAKLRVLDIPEFQKLPKDVTVEEGNVAEFYCNVSGDPPIKVQWSKQDGTISFGRARILADHTLRIEQVEPEDEGVYVCSAENAAGSTKASARLFVFSSPRFLMKPQDQVVARGRNVSLQCYTTGNPSPTIFWSKDGKNLMFSRMGSGNHMVAEDGTLRIFTVNDSDSGVYTCEALNKKGSVTASASVRVITKDLRPPPIIKLGPDNQTLGAGSVALMRCTSDGKPEPVIRWYRDNRPLLMADSRITIVASGSLRISDLRVQDSAKYTCKAVSETGETTWEAFLLVTTETTPNFPVRTSSVSFLPDAPSKPVVSDVTDTTAHLSWTPGTKSQPRPVQKFYVEYYGFDTTESWVTASRDVVTDSFTIHQLRPNSSYTFLVRAVNSEGVGFPSQPSDPIRTLGHALERTGDLTDEEIKSVLNSNIVELVNTQSINSSVISLIWRIKQGEDIIDGYQIEYKHILDIRRLEYGDPQMIRVPPIVTRYLVTGLLPYSWYELRVRAYSGTIVSWYSSPVKVQTEQTYQSGAPENVAIRKLGDKSISVVWSPPSSRRGDNSIIAYKVSCVSTDHTDNRSTATSGRTNNAIIDNLHPDKDYFVKVAAETIVGIGSWSQQFVFDGQQVFPVDEYRAASTLKPVAQEESTDGDLFKKTWFVGLLIGVGGVMLWVLLCAFSVWLCRRKRQRKKMKDQKYYPGVSQFKGDECNKNFYPPQYGFKEGNRTNELVLPPELRVLLPGQTKKEPELKEDVVGYKMAGSGGGSFNEKSFYPMDTVAPYATTALIQQQHLMKQRQQQQRQDHMFRPINQGYIQHSDGSGDSCHKGLQASDHDHSGHSTTDHNHSDHMSPTSDSGSHSTADENNMLIKQKRKPSGKRDNVSQMQHQQVALNWSDMLPPPPEHPPPSECGDPLYHEIRGEPRSTSRSRSPMSPVSFSQLSACSCPNPHTQTPVSGWNMPLYSDTECPRCHSEKYYDPMTYCQEPYIGSRRTNSPRTQLMQQQQANARNIPNNGNVSVHSCSSPRVTPCGSVHYQYSQPHVRGFPPQNCATPHQAGDNKNNFTNNVSNVNRASHSSHSDNEVQGLMPCLQSYRITSKEEKDPRYFPREKWGPDPAPPFCEQVSSMGLGGGRNWARWI